MAGERGEELRDLLRDGDNYYVLHFKLLGIASRIVGRNFAEDVVQDAFYKAVSVIDRFNGEMNLHSLRRWLFRITKYKALDFYRAMNKRRSVCGASLDNMVEHGSSYRDFIPIARGGETLDDREERELKLNLVMKKIERTPPSMGSLLILRAHGYSQQESADIFGIPVGTYKSRTSRAEEIVKEDIGDWAA
jgi:RNA polymerase sigma-70 factor, ECF subfamily